MHTKAVFPVFAATGAVAAIHGAAAPAAPQQQQQQQQPEDQVLQPGMIATKVVDSFVTYCAEPTVFTYAKVPYTVLTPGDVTITNCPCTIETTVDQPGPTGPAGPPPPPPPPEGPQGFEDCDSGCDEDEGPPPPPPSGPEDECDSGCDEDEGPPPPSPSGPDDECDSCDEGVLTLTHVVDSFVTYCPEPTVFKWDDHEYTVTTPGHLTVTNCPCTVETTMPPTATTGSGPGPTGPPGPPPPPGPGGPAGDEECDSGCDEEGGEKPEAPEGPGAGDEECDTCEDEEGGESPESSSPASASGSSPASTGAPGAGSGGNGGYEKSPEASGTVPALSPGAGSGSGSSGSGSGSYGSGSGSSGSGSGSGAGSGTGEEDESSSIGTAVQWKPTAMPTYVMSGAAGRDIAICGTMLAAFLVGVMAM